MGSGAVGCAGATTGKGDVALVREVHVIPNRGEAPLAVVHRSTTQRIPLVIAGSTVRRYAHPGGGRDFRATSPALPPRNETPMTGAPLWSDGLRCGLYQYRSAGRRGTWLWVSLDTMRFLGNPDRLACEVCGAGQFVLAPSERGRQVSLSNNGRRPVVWAAELAGLRSGVYAATVRDGLLSFRWESGERVARPLRREELNRILVDAVRESGGAALLTQGPTSNPRRLLVRCGDLALPVWVSDFDASRGTGHSARCANGAGRGVKIPARSGGGGRGSPVRGAGWR